ncbi:MAG: hypothetical protein II259_10075 [Selenomonadaceae bacterium]|nr:hypothetical protein [Selenomonadaceae bacterium]
MYFLDSRAGVAWHIYDILSPGHVLTIYCWDSTFKDIMAKYYPAYNPETEMIGDVEVHWIILPHEDNVYYSVYPAVHGAGCSRHVVGAAGV